MVLLRGQPMRLTVNVFFVPLGFHSGKRADHQHIPVGWAGFQLLGGRRSIQPSG